MLFCIAGSRTTNRITSYRTIVFYSERFAMYCQIEQSFVIVNERATNKLVINMNEAPIAQLAAKLTSERKRSGLSIAEVARQANIAKSTLSQLESGAGNPSIETLWSICGVLEIPVSRLLEIPRARVKVIRLGEGTTLASEAQNYHATLLATCPPNATRDIYFIEANPGDTHNSEPHPPGVIEHVIVTKGKARVGLSDESYELNEGDYISYPADLPHLFEAMEKGTCAIMVLESA